MHFQNLIQILSLVVPYMAWRITEARVGEDLNFRWCAPAFQ